MTPKPTVPEVFTLMGKFVRVAYNNQGFVTLGYQMAQRAVGEEWMLLEVGLTMRVARQGLHAQARAPLAQDARRHHDPPRDAEDYAKAGYLRR